MSDLSIKKIRDMLAAHNDGIYLLSARENIGEIVDFLLNHPEYWYTDDMAGDWDYLADLEDLEPGQILELSAGRTVGKAYVALINNKPELFDTREKAKEKIEQYKELEAAGGEYFDALLGIEKETL